MPDPPPAIARRLPEWLRNGRARGLVTGLVGVAVVGFALAPFRSDVSQSTPALALMVPVVLAGLLGGRAVALWTALVATAVYDVAFIDPLGSLRVAITRDAVSVGFFVLVAYLTGAVVAREARRRRAADQRADEIAALHATLQATVAERDRLEQETCRLAVLEEVDRQRAALLRAVSHDLRTPLGTIRAVASDLQAGTAFDPATRAELLELVSSEAERLDRIVTNLLSLSRIEGGALRPDRHPADLADIAGDSVRRLRRLFGDVQLTIDVPADLPSVLVDFTQIDLVVTNLLENAARHAPAGSIVCVQARACGDTIRLDVIDQGPGVDPDRRADLFGLFHAEPGGIGVGLTICRAIVEAHGGTIRLECAEQPGGHFVVTLPIAP